MDRSASGRTPRWHRSRPVLAAPSAGAVAPARSVRGGIPHRVPEPEEHLLRIENRTVTALLHLSVADRRPRLAVYMRPRGWLGRIYLRAIEPFRRHLVYPALLEAGQRAALRLRTRG